MTEPTGSENNPTTALSTADQITPLLTDLLYPSESDEPVEWVACPLKADEPLTVAQIKEWLALPPAVSVYERPEADFWQPVTTPETWYGEEETKRTATFEQLQKTMEPLTARQFFRVGETEIDLYLLGRLPDGSRAGLKTKVVET